MEAKDGIDDEAPLLHEETAKIIILGNTKCVAEYEKINLIGEGTYGTVYKARNKKTGQLGALKKVKMEYETDGFPVTSLREIKYLQRLKHPNIINLKEVSVGYKQNNVFLVFDYYEADLANLVDGLVVKNEFLTLSDIKTIMLNLLKAVEYLHKNEIIHRDLKISNILVSKTGDIRVADFGLARELGPEYKNYTKKVVTLWYRAPEILLGCDDYSTPCDIWALGGILAELLNKGRPIFPGQNEIDQFQKIGELIGKPTRDIWRDYGNMEVSK